MDDWIAGIVGKMHVHNISQNELAEHLGVRRDYINKILNGRRAPKDAESKISAAVDELIAMKQ